MWNILKCHLPYPTQCEREPNLKIKPLLHYVLVSKMKMPCVVYKAQKANQRKHVNIQCNIAFFLWDIVDFTLCLAFVIL